MNVISLLDLPHTDARAALQKDAVAWMFMNPVEYHGPHLSLHNDAIVSRKLAEALHARLWPDRPMLVASDLEIGVDPTPGPGSRKTPLPIAKALVDEACDAIATLGATRVVWMTFHGAPLHNLAIEGGLARLRARGVRAIAPFHLVMEQLIDPDEGAFADIYEPIEDASARDALRRDMRVDFHAGFLETSIALHLAPEAVSDVRLVLPPCPPLVPDRTWLRAASLARAAGADALAKELTLAAWAMGWHALSPFPGYTGAPHLANAESGRRFAEHVLARYAEAVPAVLDGRAEPPAPIMAWTERATFGGRLVPQGASARA